MKDARKWRCGIALWLCVAMITSSAFAQTAGASSSAFARARNLRPGVKLSDWFAQVYDKKGYTREHLETWNTVDDIVLIKSMGFDHVRLSVNPQPLFTMSQPKTLPREYSGY